jgi:hypothetical protein
VTIKPVDAIMIVSLRRSLNFNECEVENRELIEKSNELAGDAEFCNKVEIWKVVVLKSPPLHANLTVMPKRLETSDSVIKLK